jgi:hypothetical protein
MYAKVWPEVKGRDHVGHIDRSVDWTHLALDRDKGRSVVSTVMVLRIP